MIDFSKISYSTKVVKTDPRDIFMSLPLRDKKYEYPRDVQSEVWKKWYSEKDSKNNIIKMNTGSGKTVVGLLILKSCLNEKKGPAVYVVPDNYLVQQVCNEATELGINTTKSEDDIDFRAGESILVINIQKLFNGKSVFGMRSSNNVNFNSVLIDDVHACITTINQQFTLIIPSNECLIYEELLNLFEDALKKQSESKYSDIYESYKNKTTLIQNMLVPFWDWQNKTEDVRKILSKNNSIESLYYNLPLIIDILKLCNCYISSNKIEIIPKNIPIHKISSFSRAERRIFMSATLPDDTVFIETLGLKKEEIKYIITPEKANDLGDRLILYPQILNRSINDDEIKIKLYEYSKFLNVVVITPSRFRANFWSDVSDLVLDSTNIEEGVLKLRSRHVGLVTIINKYDGIDLPDDACRVLVIDGLPNMRSEESHYLQYILPNSQKLKSEQIQKIEQGMGRGIRSNNDFCVVFLMGKGLADVLYNLNGLQYFSEATLQQFDLSNSLSSQVKGKTLDEIFETTSLCLDRNIEWITVSKDSLANLSYDSNPKFNSISFVLREAFDLVEIGYLNEAIDLIEKTKNGLNDLEMIGYLKQIMAEYTNLFNPIKAQEILLSAKKDNRYLLKPIEGIQFTNRIVQYGSQSENLIRYISLNNLDPNKYILKIESTLEKLSFGISANKFESALRDISHLIGINSNQPEAECGFGPDNFWDVGESIFFVIECKNCTITETINKHDCNQLNGSIQWFKNLYSNPKYNCTPILIHNSNVFDYSCSPDSNIRIMTPDLLEKFKTNILTFSKSIVHGDDFINSNNISKNLNNLHLNGDSIPNEFTKRFVKQRSKK